MRGTVGGDDADSKDNSEERRQWVAKVGGQGGWCRRRRQLHVLSAAVCART